MPEIDPLAFALALLGCFAASYFDIKKKKVPNALVALLMVSSMSLAGYRVLLGDSAHVWTYLSGFFLGFALGFLLWDIKAWSGGDAKMFWSISAILPDGLFALNVLFNMAFLLAVILLIHPSIRKKKVVLMPYMTLALVASLMFQPAGLLFP